MDRLILNSYFNGKPLPRGAPLYYVANVTAQYALTGFQHSVTFNDSFGEFTLGVDYFPSGFIDVSVGPAGARISPVVVISLLSA